MTTRKKMLYSRKELLDLKTKSLKRLQEGKLTKKQQVDIEELISSIVLISSSMSTCCFNKIW